MVKTASQPFGILTDLVGSNLESIDKIGFHFLQDSFDDGQVKTLHIIEGILKKKPDLKFLFSQETDIAKEKVFLAIKECANSFFIVTTTKEEVITNDQLTNVE